MSFSGDIARFAKETGQATEAVFRGTTLDMVSRIIRRTPVQDGFLRGAWQTNINSLDTSIPGVADKSGDATIRNANETIARAKIGDVIYLSNNLPYALAIEDGHSDQRPQGMVKVTVAEFERMVKARAKKHG